VSADATGTGTAGRGLLCDVYRSPRREGMYLYVPRAQGLRDVPDALRARFGEPVLALSLMLGPDRRLARADAEEVLQALAHQGWYLQLPPAVVAPDSPLDAAAQADSSGGHGRAD